nr:anther-specific proline-rich protein APG-like [Aegilops tauschii subsp. strangulata]
MVAPRPCLPHALPCTRVPAARAPAWPAARSHRSASLARRALLLPRPLPRAPALTYAAHGSRARPSPWPTAPALSPRRPTPAPTPSPSFSGDRPHTRCLASALPARLPSPPRHSGRLPVPWPPAPRGAGRRPLRLRPPLACVPAAAARRP